MKGAFIVAADRVRQGPLYRGSFKNWMLILVLLCENECQRWDASRYIKARSEAQRFYVYRDASHLWHSFSHNRTKINIQNL